MGRLFFGSVSFIRIKEMNSPMKGETLALGQQNNNEETDSHMKCERPGLNRASK